MITAAIWLAAFGVVVYARPEDRVNYDNGPAVVGALCVWAAAVLGTVGVN